MPKWNMFDPEVAKERQKIRDYGTKNLPTCQDSYKYQALRQLALNQIYEDQITELKSRLDAAIDILDGVEAAEIVRFSGMSSEQAEKLRRRVMAG